MTLKAEWANPEKTIILQTLEGDWTLNDVFSLMENADQMISEVDHKVDLIADLTTTHFTKFNLLSTLGRVQRSNQSPNMGRIAVVNANHYLKTLTHVAAKVTPRATDNIVFVDTVEEAFTVLQQSQKA